MLAIHPLVVSFFCPWHMPTGSNILGKCQPGAILRFVLPDDFIALNQSIALVKPCNQLSPNVLLVGLSADVVRYIDSFNIFAHGLFPGLSQR
jgi:hypothetical protein